MLLILREIILFLLILMILLYLKVYGELIILSRGISNAYQTIWEKNLSMVQYNSLIQKTDFISINRLYDRYKNIIFQPILSYIFYFNGSDVEERNSGLWDKIIKRDVVIKSIFFIGKKY